MGKLAPTHKHEPPGRSENEIKTPKKKRQQYSEQNLIEAVEDVRKGILSWRKASVKYGVPVQTIGDRIHNRYVVQKVKSGRKQALNEDDENRLKYYLIISSKIGYGINRAEVPHLVKKMLDFKEEKRIKDFKLNKQQIKQLKSERKFKDNLPSKFWIYRFFDRHPELSKRIPEDMEIQRKNVKEIQVRKWFDDLEAYLLTEYGIVASDFFTDENSSRIFNVDEARFPLCGTDGQLKGILNKGIKNVYKPSSDTKTQVTVVGCCSGDGELLKPFVILPEAKPKYNLSKVDPNNFALGRSPNGCITYDSFYDWIANVFYPEIKENVTFPVILFMDGHASHMSIETLEFCKDHKIILYKFPVRSSHIIQPLDVFIYGTIKSLWDSALRSYAVNNPSLTMNKNVFFEVFEPVWLDAKRNSNYIVSGFRKCGLIPFNADVVDCPKVQNAADIDETLSLKNEDANQDALYFMRSLTLIENCLSAENKELFEVIWNGKCNVEDNSDKGQLWNIYKTFKERVEQIEVTIDKIEIQEDVKVAPIFIDNNILESFT